jgi:hypothetical protein
VVGAQLLCRVSLVQDFERTFGKGRRIMIGAEKGISAFVLSAGSLSDVDNLTAGIVVLSAIGLAISWLLGRIERRLLAWRLDQPPRPVTSLEICI